MVIAAWARTNALALAAIVALVAAFLVATGVTSSLAVRGDSPPDTRVVTDRQAPIEFANQTLSTFKSGSMTAADVGTDLRVPADTHLVAVTFESTPLPVPSPGTVEADEWRVIGTCAPLILTELTGEKRRYVSANDVLGWTMDPFLDDCVPDSVSPGVTSQAFITFIVPDDSRGPYLFTMYDGNTAPGVAVTVAADWLQPAEN